MHFHYFSTRADAEAEKDKKDPDDDYMKLLRTFEMEGRAPASDRSRTTEEVMREENEKLLKLEVIFFSIYSSSSTLFCSVFILLCI